MLEQKEGMAGSNIWNIEKAKRLIFLDCKIIRLKNDHQFELVSIKVQHRAEQLLNVLQLRLLDAKEDLMQ